MDVEAHIGGAILDGSIQMCDEVVKELRNIVVFIFACRCLL